MLSSRALLDGTMVGTGAGTAALAGTVAVEDEREGTDVMGVSRTSEGTGGEQGTACSSGAVKVGWAAIVELVDAVGSGNDCRYAVTPRLRSILGPTISTLRSRASWVSGVGSR